MHSGVTRIEPSSAPEFVENGILSPRRRLPIVAVSQDRRGNCAADPARLQQYLAGVAAVAVYDDATAQELRRLIGWQLACYNGAIRVYWPGCAPGDRSDVHKVWLPREAGELGFGLVRQIQGECLRRSAPGFDRSAFDDARWRVERERLRSRLLELEERDRQSQAEQESDEAARRISERDLTIAELKRQLGLKTRENKQLAATLSELGPAPRSRRGNRPHRPAGIRRRRPRFPTCRQGRRNPRPESPPGIPGRATRHPA